MPFRTRARDVMGNLGDYTFFVSTRIDSTRPDDDIAINGGALDTSVPRPHSRRDIPLEWRKHRAAQT